MRTLEDTSSTQVSPRIPALDGVRALAILLVIPHNVDMLKAPFPAFEYPLVALMHAGWIGVQLFFVLSGFLITGNLLDTRNSANYLSAFFGRRILRIMPLYFVALGVAFVIAPALGTVPQKLHATQSHQIWLWTFLSNWSQPFGGKVYGFGHFWSLAVEEQFYLLWPFVVLRCRPARLLWVCAAAAGVALVVRVLLLVTHAPRETLYMFTVCRMDALALGAAAAAVIRIPAALTRLQRTVPRVAAAAGMMLLVTAAGTRGFAMFDISTQTVGYTLLSLTFALIILLAALPTTGALRATMHILEWPPLRLVGRYSYGMYVIHLPLHLFLGAVLLHYFAPHVTPAAALLYAAAMTVASFVLAALCYELFESRFLRLKRKLMPTRSGASCAAVLADLAMPESADRPTRLQAGARQEWRN
jgi:peptidoglycan/LPS O-acetylase OafA/YrhL